MQGPLSTGLDFYGTVLDLRSYRQQILSSDIANASTPGFKAVDLDFQSALAAATATPASGGTPQTGAPSSPVLMVDDPRQIGGGVSNGAFAGEPQIAAAVQNQVKYQTGTQVTVDGNSVDLDLEKRQAGVNAVQYEAAATFTTNRINMLMTAIRGSGTTGTNG